MIVFTPSELQNEISHILGLDKDAWLYFNNNALYVVFHSTWEDLQRVEKDTTGYDVNHDEMHLWKEESSWTCLTPECPTFPDYLSSGEEFQFRYCVYA